MSAYYQYIVTFVDNFGKSDRALLEDGHQTPNEDELNRVLWELWRDVVSRDDVTTFIRGQHKDSVDFGWIWSKSMGELVRIF